MALYNWAGDEDLPHIFGAENANYTRDPTTDQYRINTGLPYNAQGSRSVEEVFGERGTFYGTVPDDAAAVAKLNEWKDSSFRNIDVPHLLDLIIDMPVGLRTSDN